MIECVELGVTVAKALRTSTDWLCGVDYRDGITRVPWWISSALTHQYRSCSPFHQSVLSINMLFQRCLVSGRVIFNLKSVTDYMWEPGQVIHLSEPQFPSLLNGTIILPRKLMVRAKLGNVYMQSAWYISWQIVHLQIIITIIIIGIFCNVIIQMYNNWTELLQPSDQEKLHCINYSLGTRCMLFSYNS